MNERPRKSIFGVYGYGGHGRETMPVLRELLAARGVPREDLVFIDDAKAVNAVGGHQVLSFDEFLAVPATSRAVAVAVAEGRIRARLAAKLDASGVEPLSVHPSTAVVLDDVSLGEGYLLSPFAVVTTNCRIGRFFQANVHCSVSHDCVIGDFVTLGPGARCNGNVHIGDFAYIGAGAIIRNGKPGEPVVIGREAVVGMGAVVTRSVPAGVTVVGNPARPIVP